VQINSVKRRIVMKSDVMNLPCNRYRLEYIYLLLNADACCYFCDMFRLRIMVISFHTSLRHVSSTIVLCPSFLYKQKSVRFGEKIGLKRNQIASTHKTI